MCCDFGCEARFEDGTVARGPESILGYCFGETESVVDDGTCFSDCSLVKDQATCESIGDYCHWAGDMCRGGDLGCFASYTQTSCDARDACYWTTPDITFAPKDFHPGDQFDPENVNLPTLSSPPIALGTPCPRTCENGCVGGGGAIAINESGLPKPLVNMDYCVPFDTPVLAMTDGEVVRAEKLDGDFNYALILRSSENQNFVVIYDHLGALTVSEGDTVSAGDRVGTAVHGRGDIYDSAGFEVHVNQLRGSDDFGEISPCPMHFATAEVRADAATRLLVNHVHDPYYRGSAWMLCERPFVTSY